MLQGSLENFALDEVLGLLAGTSKTGKLEIAGNRGTGVLAFNSGHLVDASASYTANGTGLEDVMFELLRYDDGTFSFNTGETPAGDSPENVASVLAAAESRLRDWRSIEGVVPSLKHQVAPCPELPTDEITITKAEWAALRVIASGCQVSAVCDKLDLGEVEGSRQIKNLAERDLVSINEPIGGYVPPSPAAAAPAAATEAPKMAPTAVPPVPGPDDFPSAETSTFGSDLGASPAPLGFASQKIDAALDPLGTDLGTDIGGEESDAGSDERPPMPPAPSADDLLTEIESSTTPPAPPSPAEISNFGDEIEDASELVSDEDDAKGGGLLARYLKSDD
jgi:hypothetical protein